MLNIRTSFKNFIIKSKNKNSFVLSENYTHKKHTVDPEVDPTIRPAKKIRASEFLIEESPNL